MAKYRVHLQPRNLWKDEIVREVIALNRKNAEDIASIYNKDCTITNVIRVGADSKSTEEDLKHMIALMNSAIADGSEEVYEQQRYAFEETVKSLKAKMNVVAWAKTKPLIPKIPVM